MMEQISLEQYNGLTTISLFVLLCEKGKVFAQNQLQKCLTAQCTVNNHVCIVVIVIVRLFKTEETLNTVSQFYNLFHKITRVGTRLKIPCNCSRK